MFRGMIEKYREFSQLIWDKYASKIQPTYDKIDSWETPEWLKKSTEKIWDQLSDPMKKKLYEFVMEILREYDSAFAKKLLQDLLKKLQELLGLRANKK
jgi:hypothetical protein